MKAAKKVVGTEEDKKEAIKRMIEGDKYDLIVNSLMRPQGLFELYDSTGIGSHLSSITERLDSVSKRYENLREYGLAMKYGIHQDTVRLQLIATTQNSYPLTYTGGTGPDRKKLRVLRAPQVLEELARFSYDHETTVIRGIDICLGKETGPLEHEIFQELKEKDPDFRRVQENIGKYMFVIGHFAQELTKRRLSID